MTTTVNLRKLLHRKSAEYCTPNPAGNNAAGTFIIADKDSILPQNDGVVYVGGVSAIWNYNADEDSWIQAPNSGIAGAFAAGACGAVRAIFAPAGNSSSTATAGTTTTINTSLTIVRNFIDHPIRVIGGTGIGYEGTIVKNTTGANSVITVTPASSVAFDNTTVFQMMTGSVWFFNSGTTSVGFSVYDRATNTWTARSVTNLPTSFGTSGALITTSGATSNSGSGFVSSTSTGTNTSTTLNDTAKTWPVNGWTNYQVRITGGTGKGQIRTISSNTATALTVSSAWTTNPDATSTYKIEGNDDFMYLIGNNAVTMYKYTVSTNTWSTISPVAARAGAPGAGSCGLWIDAVPATSWTDGTYGAHNANGMLKQLGRYIYSFKGGASSTLDVYDIASNTWYSNMAYGQQMETFTTGSSFVDVAGSIYAQKDATGRIFRFNIDENTLQPFTLNPVPQGTATESGKMFVQTYRDGATTLRYLYSLGNTRSELTRWLII